MFCVHCGSPVPDGARFCPRCGGPQAQAPVGQAPVGQAALQPQATNNQRTAPRASNQWQGGAAYGTSKAANGPAPGYASVPQGMPTAGYGGGAAASPAPAQDRTFPSASSVGDFFASLRSRLNMPLVVGIACGIVALIVVFMLISCGAGRSVSSGGVLRVSDEVIVVLTFAYVGVAIVCAFKESATTGLYKTFGVYGRIKAYLFVDAVVVALLMLVSMLALPFGGLPIGADSMLVALPLFCVAVAAAVLLYLHTRSRCPDMLRDKLLISLLISGLGITMKLVVFFIGILWKIVEPQSVVDDDGEALYVIEGYVYDRSGERVGEVNADRRSYTRYRQYVRD